MTAPILITLSFLVSLILGVDLEGWAVGFATGAVAMMVDGGRW